MGKMHDLGETYGKMEAIPEPSAEGKKEKKHYPHHYYTTEQMPEMSGKKVGDKVKLVFEGVITGMSMNDHGKGEKTEYTVEMRKGSCEDMGESETGPIDKTKKIAKMFDEEDEE